MIYLLGFNQYFYNIWSYIKAGGSNSNPLKSTQGQHEHEKMFGGPQIKGERALRAAVYIGGPHISSLI